MIHGIVDFFKAINEWGDYMQQKFVISMQQLETWRQFLFVTAVFGVPLIYAWFGHHFTPCLTILQPDGICDPITPGTLLLRRIWSFVLCGPIIVYALIRFAINRYKRHLESKK